MPQPDRTDRRRARGALAALACAALAGCACDHALDATLLERGADLIWSAAGIAHVRSLTVAERHDLEAGRQALRCYADALREEIR